MHLATYGCVSYFNSIWTDRPRDAPKLQLSTTLQAFIQPSESATPVSATSQLYFLNWTPCYRNSLGLPRFIQFHWWRDHGSPPVNMHLRSLTASPLWASPHRDTVLLEGVGHFLWIGQDEATRAPVTRVQNNWGGHTLFHEVQKPSQDEWRSAKPRTLWTRPFWVCLPWVLPGGPPPLWLPGEPLPGRRWNTQKISHAWLPSQAGGPRLDWMKNLFERLTLEHS